MPKFKCNDIIIMQNAFSFPQESNSISISKIIAIRIDNTYKLSGISLLTRERYLTLYQKKPNEITPKFKIDDIVKIIPQQQKVKRRVYHIGTIAAIHIHTKYHTHDSLLPSAQIEYTINGYNGHIAEKDLIKV